MSGKSFVPLFVTNFFGVANDNYLKTLASFSVIGWLADAHMQSVFMGLTAAALVLPYILCSPLADRLTVIWSKKRILVLAKCAEIPIVALACLGLWQHSVACVVAAVLLMGLQSSLYSPSKYALIRDIGGEERISTGMGGMEGIAFLAVLLGTIAASFAADLCPAWVQGGVLLLLAVLGLFGSFTIRAVEQRNSSIHSVNPVRYMRRAFRIASRYAGLNAIIVTLSVFWWTAAMLQIGLLVYGRQVLGLSSTLTGAILALAAVGIVVGQILAGFVDRHIPLLHYTFLTGMIASVLLAGMYALPLSPRVFAMLVSVLAFDLGFFKLPLDAEIQKTVKGPKLNTILAYFNQVSFLFMLAASAVYTGASVLWGPRAFLLLLAVSMACASAFIVLSSRRVLLSVGRWFLSRRYAVTAVGLETAFRRESRAFLVLPNHPAMVDPLLVSATLRDRPLSPLCDEAFFRCGWPVAHVLKTVGAVEVPDLRKHRSAAAAHAARGLKDIVLAALDNGRNVLLYPSGHIWTTAGREEIGTRQLAYSLCGELPSGVDVVAVRTSGLWGSVWSRKGRKSSPNLVLTLLKSLSLWPLCFVRQRRQVKMEFENLTECAREWSKLTRLEFNGKLENWYNGDFAASEHNSANATHNP